MKKYFCFLAALAALTTVSCTREPAVPDGKPVHVFVSVQSEAPTRVPDATYANESAVSNLQVFIFKNKKLEDYKSVNNATTVQMTASSGDRSIWAVVNAPAITDLTDEDALKSRVTELSANSSNAFVMAGSTTHALTDGGSVPVTVKRIVSRVAIQEIHTAFQYSLASETLTIKSIYLINVAGNCTYEGTGTPTAWVNQLGHVDAGYDALLFDTVNTGVTNSTPYTTEHVFYPYPNPTTASAFTTPFTARHTMLVVEVTFEGQTGYYPIELPVMERNKKYTIEKLTIKSRPGSVPYKPLENGAADIVITVNPWEDGAILGPYEL